MPESEKSPGRAMPARRQESYATAMARALEAAARQPDDQLAWLGASSAKGVWRLPVLNDVFVVDSAAGRVTTASGHEVGASWRILALHYLAVGSRPEPRPPEITFADLPTARAYAGVYDARVIRRLCRTAGRTAGQFRAAAASLGGRALAAGDSAFDFACFPRAPLRLIWYAADEEFPPTATLLLPGNILELFCEEDVVVLSECLVARLGGRPF
jgi:hypothetical protein